MVEDDDTLATLGGKALNLRRLAAAGFPVPEFVTLPADEYRAFVDDANLRAPLLDAVTANEPSVAAALIRSAFADAPLRRKQRERLAALVDPLADAPVAVRSSATAEDLPDLSFAGQLESFLGVTGTDAILDAVVACWASAWTERVIAYRARNGVPHDDVAVAVIVQRLVLPDAAGVLFTANPLTGHRGQVVIDATPGLAEDLVQGRVTPDTYVVDAATGVVTQRTLAGERPTLTADHVHALSELGRRITVEFGSPQDVEWVLVGDDVQVVQSRPITSLFPLPSDDPSTVWASFGAFQGMLEPITPLGRDVLRHLLAGAGRAFGRVVDPSTATFVGDAGERLWIRVDAILRQEAGRRLVDTFLPMADPAAARILRLLGAERRFAVTRRAPSLSLAAGAAAFAGRIVPLLPATLRRPASARGHLEDRVDSMLGDLERSLNSVARVADDRLRLEGVVLATEKFARGGLSALLPAFGPIMGPGMLATHQLRQLATRTNLPDADALALHALRALPGNVTTAMDFALWDTARALRSDPHAWGVVADSAPVDLARRYLAGRLPTVAQEAVGAFLAEFGMRGVAEIDLGAPRWRDDPAPLFATLQSYVTTDADVPSPRDTHREGQRAAGRAVRALADASPARQAREIRALVHRIRATMGARETPKFALVRGLGLIRLAVVREAEVLVAAGVLQSVDDVFFLTLDELRHAHDTGGLAEAVAGRREARRREARRTAVPRVLVGDGRAFFEGVDPDPGALSGVGVSPGVAEGRVHVILDPRADQVAPGEVLVCPGTDPAWTPLFLHAAALVTEVGGLMTHGSVVAREYGIPAVVGVHDATNRLTTGQRVRIDGTAGTIELLA